VVSVYMTGEGQTSPPGQNGVITPVDGSVLKRPLGNVTASVANLPATVTYAGSAPGSPNGVMQVNVQIPANAPSGAVAILITVGTASTQGSVTVTVQ
jgi:trimeric autotransporter adhesin